MKTVIFCYTLTVSPNNTAKPVRNVEGNIKIDTGCVFGGILTALVTEDGEIKGAYCKRTDLRSMVPMNSEKIRYRCCDSF